MSQRECAGFNWPPSSIPAKEPVSSCPSAVSRAGSHNLETAVSVSATPLEWRMPALSASSALGVGHPASVTCLGSWSSLVRSEPSGFVAVVAIPGVSFQSLALGVAQPANNA